VRLSFVRRCLLTCARRWRSTWLFGYDLDASARARHFIRPGLPSTSGLSFGWILRGHERMDSRTALLKTLVLKRPTLILAIACLALGGRPLVRLSSSGPPPG